MQWSYWLHSNCYIWPSGLDFQYQGLAQLTLSWDKNWDSHSYRHMRDQYLENNAWDRQYDYQGPVSISDKTSYCKISWSLEAAMLVVWIITSLCNLTSTSEAVLPKRLSNFIAIVRFLRQISRLRDVARSFKKTSHQILKYGPAYHTVNHMQMFIGCLNKFHFC